jgi:hypothetical protein
MAFFSTGFNTPRCVLWLLGMLTPIDYTNALKCKHCGQMFAYQDEESEDAACEHAVAHLRIMHPEQQRGYTPRPGVPA